MCVLNSGRVRCSGYNGRNQSQLGRPRLSGWSTRLDLVAGLSSDVEQIQTGGVWTCARRRGGTVACWGRNGGYIGNGRGLIIAQSATQIVNITDAEQLYVGSSHACVRQRDNRIACWGSNSYAQLGVQWPTSPRSPIFVGAFVGASSISLGFRGTFVIDDHQAYWIGETYATGGGRAQAEELTLMQH